MVFHNDKSRVYQIRDGGPMSTQYGFKILVVGRSALISSMGLV